MSDSLDTEAFGLVVAEALARNCKLFASKIGGIPDIASGVEGAEVFDLAGIAGLRAAVVRWLASGSRRLSSAAHIMRERYHPDVIAERHVHIYRGLSSG